MNNQQDIENNLVILIKACIEEEEEIEFESFQTKRRKRNLEQSCFCPI